jgi:ABC-2 type transport system permease protein
MSGNSAFQLVHESGWRAGLKNLLRADLHGWWRTRKWWIQCLIWIGVIDLILFLVVFISRTSPSDAMPSSELLLLYTVFGGLFPTIGVNILMQSAIVGEKQSGTAAWVLSKPVSRASFILAKLLSNALGVAITVLLVPGLVAYVIISWGATTDIQPHYFVGGLGIMYLSVVYWLCFTLMLGAFFKSRGAVIGIPLALILGQQLIISLVNWISPRIVKFLPYALVTPPGDDGSGSIASEVILGQSITTWTPILASLVTIFVFIGLAVWRFNREEF